MESKARTSAEQFSALLEFMESRGDLSKPQTGAQGRLKSEKMWSILANALNSIGGGVKRTPEQWKKVWADWKCKTKKKSLSIRRHRSGTGGGPNVELKLSLLETRLLALMGSLAAAGMQEIVEVGFNSPSVSTSNDSGDGSSPVEILLPPPEFCDPILPAATTTPPSPTRQTLSPHRSPCRRLLNRRRKRTQTPFDRATNEFVGIEKLRLQIEQIRQINDDKMELQRNELLRRIVDVIENYLQR